MTLTDGLGDTVVEGVDVDEISDPLISSDGNFDEWHEAPTVGVSEGSRLVPGDAVQVDYYAVAPIYGYEVGACLTAEGTHDWMSETTAALDEVFVESPGVLMAYDEMRHLNTCAGCQATGLTPGELLAWHTGVANQMVLDVRPGADIYVWSDMFDPTHNAVDGYYLVDGDLSGSWDGLQEENIVMNWHHLTTGSLAHFEALGLRQVIAGYYDSGDGSGSAAEDLVAAGGVEGVVGYMYTTWGADYSELEAYAETIMAGR